MSRGVVLASRNDGKLLELRALLAPVGWQLSSVSDFDQTAPEESAPTFLENALLKARHATQVAKLPAIADDSGLVVDALDGRPGVQSARFAGAGVSDANNNQKLLELLSDVPDDQRTAHFVCVMVFLRQVADPEPLVAHARWRGRILRAPRGTSGFGYDPLFLAEDQDRSAAELAPDVKNRLSHRGQAARTLVAQLARQ
jgi:XTP/dITP diphosphohydrolase